MKAKTVIHLFDEPPIRVSEPFDNVIRATVGGDITGFLALTRITDHGTRKQAAVAIRSIVRVEQA